MTAPTTPAVIAPECRIAAHAWCTGPYENRVPGMSVPVEVVRCDCTCHRAPPTKIPAR